MYDGRRISTATGGRQIDFSTVGVDFIGQLSVLKTPDVSLSSSSIGATVDIQFPKPFDHPGFRLATTGSGSIQERAGRIVPTAGLLISDTNEDETFGVLADVIYTRRDTDTNRVYVSGWPGGNFAPCQLAGNAGAGACSPTSDTTSAAYANPNNRQNLPGWFPQQYGAEQQRVKDERVDARVAFQYHPTDDLMVTLDNNFPESIPDRLKGLMDLWRFQSPWVHDEFDRAEEVFPSASYQYVLYGMGARTAVMPGSIDDDLALARRARRARHDNQVQAQRLVSSLPGHRDLIDRIKRHGLQPI